MHVRWDITILCVWIAFAALQVKPVSFNHYHFIYTIIVITGDRTQSS